jgi:hypothetical protein
MSFAMAACGGGSQVKSTPPPPITNPPLPPPPPPPPPAGFTTYTLTVPYNGEPYPVYANLNGGTLFKRGGPMYLEGVNTFSGSLEIEENQIFLFPDAKGDGVITGNVNLRSVGIPDWDFSTDLWMGRHVGDASTKPVTINGNVNLEPYTTLRLDGVINGNLTNAGRIYASAAGTDGFARYLGHSRINGDYVQTATGELWLTFKADLRISGAAALDGTLTLADMIDVAYRPDGSSEVLLHADKGVNGTFATFNPLPLLAGTLEYQANDVVFHVSQASASAIMRADDADAMTLDGAVLLDHAFDSANRLAALPAGSLTDAQQRFLTSAGAMQRLPDLERVRASLDSLSGHTYAAAQAQLLSQLAMAPIRKIGDRLAMPSGAATGHWNSDDPAYRSGFASDYASGYDFSPARNWMVGSSIFFGDAQSWSAREGALSSGPSAGAQVYARWRNDNGAYLAGMLGYGGQHLHTTRRIDLGDGNDHLAWSHRDLDLLNVHVEAGHALASSHRLAGFVAMDAAALHGNGFVEQGDTGFELLAKPARMSQATIGVGARYARDWRLGDRWLRLMLDGGYDRAFAGSGASLRATLAGAPDTWFQIGMPMREDRSWFGLGLSGGGRIWSWRLDHVQDNGIVRDNPWTFGIKRSF